MCEEPVQDPKAALKQLQPVVEAKQGEGAAYLQQLMKLTNNPEKNDELLEQVLACGAVGGGGRGAWPPPPPTSILAQKVTLFRFVSE